MVSDMDIATDTSDNLPPAKVHHLSSAILAARDSLDVMRILRARLRELVPCQRLSILFHNETSRAFYVDADLNGHAGRSRDGSTLLNEADTGLSEVLTSRQGVIRNFAGPRRPSEGELRFFGDRLVSDMAVPLLIGDRVLGLFHFSSDRPEAFNERQQDEVAEVAALAALALDRTRLHEALQRRKEEAARWRDRYYRVLRATGAAITLVNWKDDLIYETNHPFARLVGRSETDLHGMRFTDMFAPESRAEVTMVLHKVDHAEHATIKEVQLLKGAGEPQKTAVRLTLFQLPSREALAIAVLQEMPRGNRSLLEARRRDHEWLEMIKLYGALSRQGSADELLGASVQRLGEIFKARYGAVLMLDPVTRELKLSHARRIGPPKRDGVEPAWLAGLGEGPYAELLAEQDIVCVPDVHADGRFLRWRPIAEKLGYHGVLAAPLCVKDRTLGLLGLFFERQRLPTPDDLHFVRAISAYLAMAMENLRLFTEADVHARRLAVLHEITRLINASLDMREVIRTTAVEAIRVMDFDLATVSLFDEGGANLQTLKVASRRLAMHVQNARRTGRRKSAEFVGWTPFFDGADLGWVDDKFLPAPEPELPASWFRSEISSLLLSQERFLGTLALSSLEPKAYAPADTEFLKQIASQMATAMGNARLFSDVQQRVIELSALAEVAPSINSSLDTGDILKQSIKTVMRTLGARGCLVQILSKDIPPVEERAGTMPAMDWLNIRDHRQKIVEKSEPVIIKNLAEDLPGSTDANAAKLEGALLAYPVASRERVMGVLYVWWEEARAVSRHDLELVTTITAQVASAIENARLYNESLVNARKLEKVNEELENFVFTVSHDLKSPVVSVQGFATILLGDCKDRLDDTARHYLERIQNNANQMERLIADLLELSRIGRVINPSAEVPAQDIIQRALSDFAFALEEKEIRLCMQDSLPSIWCDPPRLTQVFANLIGNAVKFAGQQPAPLIEIGCADKGAHFLFHVRDNGIGIDEKYHEKIFGLFQGLHQLKGVEGTGVGLTIVRRIVENHGGKVWVESSEGTGATFYFTLPKQPLAAAPP